MDKRRQHRRPVWAMWSPGFNVLAFAMVAGMLFGLAACERGPSTDGGSAQLPETTGPGASGGPEYGADTLQSAVSRLRVAARDALRTHGATGNTEAKDTVEVRGSGGASSMRGPS